MSGSGKLVVRLDATAVIAAQFNRLARDILEEELARIDPTNGVLHALREYRGPVGSASIEDDPHWPASDISDEDGDDTQDCPITWRPHEWRTGVGEGGSHDRSAKA